MAVRLSSEAAGGLALAVALPPLLLHVTHQPGFTVTPGGVSVHVVLADVVVVSLALAALAVGVRFGFGPLRKGLPIWLLGLGFVVLVLAAVAYPLARDVAYPWRTHLVSAAKFCEYALLAPAVALLARRSRDFVPLFVAVVGWSVAASLVGVAQFFGLDFAGPWPAGYRQPSFLGHHDFAGLSGASLAAGVACLVFGLPVRRAVVAVCLASGVAGLIVSGASAGAIGAVLAVATAAGLARARGRLTVRTLTALAVPAVVVVAGVASLRGGDLNAFVRWLGLRKEHAADTRAVQTYSQRTVLAYIGWRIFLDHPVLGAGWQASYDAATFGPHLDDARRKFPSTAPLAFPSAEHPYGVQNAFVQALSDLGAVGALLYIGVFASALLFAARSALRGPPAVGAVAAAGGLTLLVVIPLLAAVGLISGLPINAVTWLAVGVCAAAAALQD